MKTGLEIRRRDTFWQFVAGLFAPALLVAPWAVEAQAPVETRILSIDAHPQVRTPAWPRHSDCRRPTMAASSARGASCSCVYVSIAHQSLLI